MVSVFTSSAGRSWVYHHFYDGFIIISMRVTPWLACSLRVR